MTNLQPRKAFLFIGNYFGTNPVTGNEWTKVSGQWKWIQTNAGQGDGICNPEHQAEMVADDGIPATDWRLTSVYDFTLSTTNGSGCIDANSDTYCDATLFGDAYLDYIDSGHAIPGH